MLVRRRTGGFTLIELMVAVAIMIIALALGLPGIAGWLQNAQIRTAAEGVASGLRTARFEALRRNTHVEFVLDSPSTQGGTGWMVREARTAAIIQRSPNAVGSPSVILSALPATATTVTFNGFGRVPSAVNTDNTATLTAIVIDSATLPSADSRDLRITIPAGGGVRMCDPNMTYAEDPRQC